MEFVCVGDVIEESIRINAEAIDSWSVKVVKEFDADSTVETDRHKVQQILVNLISNAIDATVKSELPTIRIVLTNQQDDICIKIIDNGVGIPAEKLEEIFVHGFTTKKHGHGFGLHSSAIAAKVLGGSLAVHSDGETKGATFILCLPKTADVETGSESTADSRLFPELNLPPSTSSSAADWRY